MTIVAIDMDREYRQWRKYRFIWLFWRIATSAIDHKQAALIMRLLPPNLRDEIEDEHGDLIGYIFHAFECAEENTDVYFDDPLSLHDAWLFAWKGGWEGPGWYLINEEECRFFGNNEKEAREYLPDAYRFQTPQQFACFYRCGKYIEVP